MLPIIGLAGNANSGKNTAANELIGYFNAQTIALADPLKRFLQAVLLFDEDTLWGPSENRNKIQDIDERFDTARFEYNALTFVENVCNGDTIAYTQALNKLRSWYSALKLHCQDKNQITARIALQTLGDWGRSVSESLWVKYGCRIANSLLTNTDTYLPSAGLLSGNHHTDLVIITDVRYRNEILGIKKLGGYVIKINRLNQSTDTHSSETELDKIPHWFYDLIIENTSTLETFQKLVVSSVTKLLEPKLILP